MIREKIILGTILSMIFYNVTGISPGGLIVPGYLAIYVSEPRRVVMTVACGAIIAIIVKILSRYIIIYGRRQFCVCVLLSFLMKFIQSDMGIGMLISGILANEILRNGYVKTIAALILVTIATSCLYRVLGAYL